MDFHYLVWGFIHSALHGLPLLFGQQNFFFPRRQENLLFSLPLPKNRPLGYFFISNKLTWELILVVFCYNLTDQIFPISKEFQEILEYDELSEYLF